MKTVSAAGARSSVAGRFDDGARADDAILADDGFAENAREGLDHGIHADTDLRVNGDSLGAFDGDAGGQ